MPNQPFEEKHFFWTKVYIQNFFRTASEEFRPGFLIIFRRFQWKFFREKTFPFKKSCLFPVNAEISSINLVETFWQDVQNCLSIVQRSMIPGKNCFFENVDFFSNSDLEHILFENFAATFRQLRDHYNPSVHRIVLKKKCSLFDRYQIFSFTDFDRGIFEHSKKTILSVLSIRHSTYPEERLDEIFFLQRIRIVLPFLDFEWKISWILPWKLCHSCPNCSCVSRLRFPVIFFVKIVQILLSFLYFDWFGIIFCWIFVGRVCKTAL